MQLREIKETDVFQWPHLVAWMGGILCALVPFIGAWEVGTMEVPLRFGSGNFGFNVMIGSGFCMLGGMVGGYWWRLGKWMVGRNDAQLRLMAGVLLGLGVLGCVTDVIHPYFLYLVGVVLLSGLLAAWMQRKKYSRRSVRDGVSLLNFLDWFQRKSPWNAVFFLLLFLVLLVNNLTLAWGLDLSFGVKLEAVLGRILTQAVLVGTCFLLIEMAMRATPRYFRWSPWLVFSLLPFLVIADQLIGKMWNRPLINVVNSMTQSGSFKPEVELAASGIDVSHLVAYLIVLGIWFAAGVFTVGCWVVSKRLKYSISMRRASFVIVVLWLVLVIEHGVGASWQTVVDRQTTQKAFKIQLGLFTPPAGVGTYRVTFYSGESKFSGEIPALTKKPDVFVFMLESTRADAIRPDVAPFLSHFRDTECQELGTTWSGSNATHLSWFSFFHSRIPIFWREALEAIPEPEAFAGSIPLQQIKQAGYEIEVRAVCDLSYKKFGLSNFGFGNNLAKEVVQADDKTEFSTFGISERERLCFEYLRKSVLSRPEGGGFYYTAMDSPHYNYYWHNEFQPPFSEYDEDTQFPLNPTKEEVQRVMHRYWNAVAWTDHLIADFCKFLKSEGRYDECIIVVTGDHGEEFQEHGSWFHCSSLQPEQTNVPILIKWPKSMGRGPKKSTANHLDVMPSLMSALGLPDESIRGLAGKNLLADDGEHTAISTTAYVGQSGETMVLHRDGYKAVFSWGQYWEALVPDKMVLEELSGPDGKIGLKDPEAYKAEIQRLFPDAFERFFKTFEVVK